MPGPAADRRLLNRPQHLRAVSGGAEEAPPPPPRLLTLAGEQVADEWAPQLEEAFEPLETRATIAWLVSSIDAASKDLDVALSDRPIALVRFLVDRMASVLLQLAAADPDCEKEELLRLLHGVDLVRQLGSPDWDRYFSSQMTGPDGLNLVIEVAHDIRSPLTSIRCLAETLERGQSGPVTDRQRKQLQLIYSAALGLGTMATDVIEMARRGDRLVEGEAVPFSLSELLESVAEMVRPIAEERQLSFTYTTPAADQRVGLPFVVNRVLLNLVTNALKFTEEGGVDVQVRAMGMSRVEFAVQDTGRGISEEAAANLYRPFRWTAARAGRSGYFFSGTGLGLAMCRKLLRALDSDLACETAPGNGTRFSFELELPQATRF